MEDCTKLIKRYVHINSSNLTTGSENDLQIQFGFTVRKIKRVSLQRFSIYNTLYNVTSANNYLYWETEASADTFTGHSGSIPVGYYTPATLATAVQTVMNKSDTSQTYTVTYNAASYKITISGSAYSIFISVNSTNTGMMTVGFPYGYSTIAQTQTASNIP